MCCDPEREGERERVGGGGGGGGGGEEGRRRADREGMKKAKETRRQGKEDNKGWKKTGP